MKRKLQIMFLCVAIVIVTTMIVVFNGHNRLSSTDQVTQQISRIDAYLTSGDNPWQRQSVTAVTPSVYADAAGNTIVFHSCITTYTGQVPAIAGVNLRTVSAIFDPGAAASSREAQVSGFPARWYELDARSYLCWTVSPHLSCVIEYTPGTVSEADVLRMAQSVK